MDKLLTSAEVAHQLGIPESEVARLVERGRLKAIRLGPEMVRFHPQDVAACQVAHRSPPLARQAPTPEARPPSGWERLRDFVYAYDFYLLAAILVAAILAVILTIH